MRPTTASLNTPHRRLTGSATQPARRHRSSASPERTKHSAPRHRSNNLSLRLWLFALLLPALICAEAGKLYRYVDEQGNVHYTDKIPPSQIRQARDELSERGIQVDSVLQAKTAEEVAKERELERLRAERQRLIEKQKAADRVLLRTFRSADDLIMARDGKIQAIDVMISVAQSNIRRYQIKMTDLQRRAANLERAGKFTPDRLVTDINNTRRNILKGHTQILNKEQEKETIRAVYDQDLARFRQLKNLTAQESVAETTQPRMLDNLISCKTPTDCDQAWERAEVFVRKHATTRLRMHGDSIIMTAPPHAPEDISIIISRIPDRASGGTVLFMDLTCKDTSSGKQLCAGERVAGIRAAYHREVGGAARKE